MTKIVDNYAVLEEIGSGQYSTVHKGRHVLAGELVAIKVFKLDRLGNNPEIKELIDEEIRVLRTIDSPYVIKNLKMLKTSHNIYEVYEFCEQGNLYNMLHKKGSLSEKEALLIFKDLVSAIKVLYANSSLCIIVQM